MPKNSVDYLSCEVGRYSGGIAFVGVNVHCKGKLVAYSYNNIAENGLSAGAFNLYRNDLLVFKTVFLGIGRGHMNVAFGTDYTVVKLNLAGGADKLTSVCSLGIARFADKVR